LRRCFRRLIDQSCFTGRLADIHHHRTLRPQFDDVCCIWSSACQCHLTSITLSQPRMPPGSLPSWPLELHSLPWFRPMRSFLAVSGGSRWAMGSLPLLSLIPLPPARPKSSSIAPGSQATSRLRHTCSPLGSI